MTKISLFYYLKVDNLNCWFMLQKQKGKLKNDYFSDTGKWRIPLWIRHATLLRATHNLVDSSFQEKCLFYTLASVRLIAQLLWDKKSSQRTEARELSPEDTDDRAPETRAPRKRPPRPCTGIRNFCTKYVAIESVF